MYKNINKNTQNQEGILNYKPMDFSDTNINTYTLKINSKDRNINREPNPFKFDIIFNEYQQSNDQKAVITSKFNNIKRISLSQIIIPRFIPRDYIGEPVTGITPLKYDSTSINLSYYPGININNNVMIVLDSSGNQLKIEILEMVDLCCKKLYLIPLRFNNAFYQTFYINLKADLYSYLNINNNIYPIEDINGTIITLSDYACNLFPLPDFTNNRLIIGDFYKNVIALNMNTGITLNSIIRVTYNLIIILNCNFLNFQYLFPNQFLEIQIIDKTTRQFIEIGLFKVSSLDYTTIDTSNNVLIISGQWVYLPKTYQSLLLTNAYTILNSPSITNIYDDQYTFLTTTLPNYLTSPIPPIPTSQYNLINGKINAALSYYNNNLLDNTQITNLQTELGNEIDYLSDVLYDYNTAISAQTNTFNSLTPIDITSKLILDICILLNPYNNNSCTTAYYSSSLTTSVTVNNDIDHIIRLSQFNYGIKDLFEEKVFYLNLNPFVPSKNVSTDPTMNNLFGVLYPSTPNNTKDYLYLKGDAIETYTNSNLQTSNNKIQFSLMDSTNTQIGTIYNSYRNLYTPTDISIQSYLPFIPDLNIILKIEEVDKKFNDIG